jgi:hypothetical protein
MANGRSAAAYQDVAGHFQDCVAPAGHPLAPLFVANAE